MHTPNNLRYSVEHNRLKFSAGIFRKMCAFVLEILCVDDGASWQEGEYYTLTEVIIIYL